MTINERDECQVHIFEKPRLLPVPVITKLQKGNSKIKLDRLMVSFLDNCFSNSFYKFLEIKLKFDYELKWNLNYLSLSFRKCRFRTYGLLNYFIVIKFLSGRITGLFSVFIFIGFALDDWFIRNLLNRFVHFMFLIYSSIFHAQTFSMSFLSEFISDFAVPTRMCWASIH